MIPLEMDSNGVKDRVGKEYYWGWFTCARSPHEDSSIKSCIVRLSGLWFMGGSTANITAFHPQHTTSQYPALKEACGTVGISPAWL